MSLLKRKPYNMKKINFIVKYTVLIRMIFSTFLLFISGFLVRSYINSQLSYDLLSILLIFISMNLFSDILSIPNFSCNSLLNSRPRDRVFSSNIDLKDKFKRKVEWILYWKYDNKFKSYIEYKEIWNKNMKIRDDISQQYDHIKSRIKVVKGTLSWFIHRRN